MVISLIISRIICMSSFCSLCTNCTVVQKRKLKKNTPEKKDNNSNVQSKADSDEDGDSKNVITKTPSKKKIKKL